MSHTPTKEITISQADEEEFARAFPQHIGPKTPKIPDEEYDSSSQNEKIIKKADEIMIDRMNLSPESISIRDVIGIKAEANKQLNAEKGIADPNLGPAVIPTNINIQIINK